MVKKVILLLLLLIGTILSTICGQSSKNKFKREWNIGVGFGPTFSAVDFRDNYGQTVSTKSLMQYHGGISVRYLSEKNLGIIAELNYSQQGWEQDFKYDVDNPEYSLNAHKHTLNYFEIPVMTHIYFGRKVRFVINLGPKISYLISDSEEINDHLSNYLKSGDIGQYTITHQYYRKAEKKFDYGIIAGMGLELRTGIGHFLLEGRYSFGLGDIYNNTKSDFFQRSANRVISARLTYYIKSF